MIFKFFVVLCLVSFAVGSSPSRSKYKYFDDYLSSLDAREQAMITGDELEDEGSGDPDENNLTISDLPIRQFPLRTGLRRSKEVTCCALGQLAGDKGYHCFVKFYMARIVIRNTNRAHNRKMSFHGRDRVSNYGTKLMRTFEQCVAGRGMVFHKCCHVAAIDRKQTPPHFDTLQRERYQQKLVRMAT